MARGDAELHCLNVVRKYAVKSEFGGYMLSDRNDWYGLHYKHGAENDMALLADIIMSCEPNIAVSKFPDFLHSSGFVEHFRVSSTDRGRRGFESVKKDNEHRQDSFDRLSKGNEEYLRAHPEESSCLSFGITTYTAPVQSYDVFCKSFKAHWEKHIKSLYSYSGVKDVGVFLIECMDTGFSMAENARADCSKEDVHLGSLIREPERFHTLRLSRCDDLLEYMYGYRDDIQYVVYVCPDAIEFFRTDELMYVKSFIKHPYLKYGCLGIEMQQNTCVTVRRDDGSM